MTPHTLPPLTLTLGGQHLLMPIWPCDTWRPGQYDPPLTSNLIFCLQSVLHMGTQVFILSCATLIMALILSSWAQRKSSHFPIQANTHASLLYLVYKVTLGPSFLSSYYFSIIWYKKCLSLFSLTQQDSWIRELTSCSCGPSDFTLIKTAVTSTK